MSCPKKMKCSTPEIPNKNENIPNNESKPISDAPNRAINRGCKCKGVICPICFEPIKDIATTDKCQHLICSGCLTEWSGSKKTCPICRIKFHEVIINKMCADTCNPWCKICNGNLDLGPLKHTRLSLRIVHPEPGSSPLTEQFRTPIHLQHAGQSIPPFTITSHVQFMPNTPAVSHTQAFDPLNFWNTHRTPNTSLNLLTPEVTSTISLPSGSNTIPHTVTSVLETKETPTQTSTSTSNAVAQHPPPVNPVIILSAGVIPLPPRGRARVRFMRRLEQLNRLSEQLRRAEGANHSLEFQRCDDT